MENFLENLFESSQNLSVTGELLFWAVLTVLCIIVEAITAGLIAIWFVLGALAAFVSVFFGVPFVYQLVIFAGTATVTILLVRPTAKSCLGIHETATNVDSLIGMKGVVLETVNNLRETGRVKVNKLTWTARSVDGTEIAEDRIIEVQRVEGVTLFVLEAAEND